MRNLKYYLPGSLLILVAIMIAVVPEILVAVVSASIIMVGIGALHIGHMIRKLDNENRDFENPFVMNDPFERWFRGSPISIRWHRRF